MEERIPPHRDHNPTPSSLPPPPGATGGNDRARTLELVQSIDNHGTYVIQIPKDQIYRVPPPENAEIIKRYRHPERKKTSPCKRCICCSVLTVLILTLLGVASAAVYTLTLKPVVPHFEIKHLVTKYGKDGSSKTPHPSGYDVLLEARNPNSVIKLDYEEGKVRFLHKGNELGKGESPLLEQEGKGVDEVHVPIVSTVKGKLPTDLEDTLTLKGPAKTDKKKKKNEKEKKKEIELRLKMNVPLKLKTWMSTKNKELSVTCDFKVSSLAKDKDANIISQSCQTVYG